MGSLFHDIRYGFRSLARSPGFTVIAVFSLALAIAANTSIFSVIEAVVLRPLPYQDPSRLVLLADSQDSEEGGFLYKDFDVLRSENQTLQDLAIYYRDSGFSRVTLASVSGPVSLQGAFTSANLFPLMGVPPILGRVFTAEEEKRKDRVVVLSHGLWMSQFGASPDVIGKTLQIDGISSQVIGVMPTTFQFPARDQQFWAPITTNHFWGDPALRNTDPGRSTGFYQRWQAIGRLKPGVKLQQAQVEIGTIFARLRQEDNDPNRSVGVSLLPLRVTLSGNTRLAFIVLSLPWDSYC
jgi:putative ABC transport system permease protein